MYTLPFKTATDWALAWLLPSVSFCKKRLGLGRGLYTILQVLSVTLFEKKPILQVFSENDLTFLEGTQPKHLPLFDL